MTTAELVAKFGTIEAGLDKVAGETAAAVAEIAALKQLIIDQPVPADVEAAINRVSDKVASIDALVPDATP